METKNSQSNQKGFFAEFLKWLPLVQWILTILIAAGVIVLSQRDSQTAQAQETKDNSRKIQALEIYVDKRKDERDRQYEQLRREMLTRELFEAYHKSDADRMDRLEKMLEQSLQR